MASRSRATGRVTLNDVAAVAQVSPITASRALRGQANVSAELAARVRAAADKLGYVPDPAARALASAHGSQVAVLLPTLAAPYGELFEALESTLRSAGLQTLVALTHHERDEEEPLLRALLPHRPAGVVVAGLERSAAARQLIASGRAPCVQLMGLAADPATPSVGFSHVEAGAAVTRHLLERGRRRIAFVGARPDALALQCAEGWRRTLHEAGLHDARREVLDARPSSVALGAELFEQLHERQRATDAIFFGDDALAQGALLAALRLHVRVPQQVAVAGFGDLAGSEQMPPPLTSVRTRGDAIGREAARLLLSLLAGEAPERTTIDVGFELVVRGSS